MSFYKDFLNKIIKTNCQRIIDIIDYPELLRTLGKDIDRNFVRDLLFLKRRLNFSPNTVIDVGAAVGEFTKAARFVFPNPTIYAFEPIPELFSILKRNVQDKSNVLIFNFAIASENKISSFYLNEFAFSSSLLAMTKLHKEIFPDTMNDSIITVECKRLDSIKEITIIKPVFMKIDVQGAEIEVIKGGEHLLRDVDVVQLEVCFEPLYKDQAQYADLVSYMSRLGFRSFLQINPHFSSTHQFTPIFCDLVFFK
jgi:FkbM family methyltransferase